jgi:RNA polymerase sigma-B factor
VTSVEDRALLRRYHVEGDLSARQQLIEQYMSLVRSLARRYSYRGEQLDDLVQIGAIGLIKAIDRFDIDRGVELTTYATPNIIGEIKRHFRDKGWSVRVPRGLQELNVQLSKLIEAKTVELGRSPTIPELAKAAGAEEEEVLEALEASGAYKATSLEAPRGNEDDAGDTLGDTLGTEERGFSLAEDRATIEHLMRSITPREREVLRLRFEEDLTQAEIGELIGVSQMQVSRIIRQSVGRLRAYAAARHKPAPPD